MIYTRVAVLAALGGILGVVQATPLQDRNNDKGSAPWPSIPAQTTYKQPSGSVYVYPVSVAKGLTSNHSQSSASSIALKNVGDIYTRTSTGLSVLLPCSLTNFC